MSDPSAGVIHILRRTRPWVFSLSVVGFLTVGLFVLLSILSLSGIATGRIGRQEPIVSLVVYPVLGLLWLVPSLYLFRYAKRINTFVAQGHQVQLEAALEAQRRFWAFTGVMTMVIVGLTALALLAGIAIGVIASL